MTEDTIKVRVAVPADETAIMDLVRIIHGENGLYSLNAEKVRLALKWALYLGKGICGVIGDIGKPLEAVVLLQIVGHWYTDDVHLEELDVFTHPDFRAAKGGRARKLLQFSKAAADGLGLPLAIGILSNERSAAKVRLYEREFGPPAGAFFVYGGKTGAFGSVVRGD